jgi:two-component system, NtrC family, sensor kinase
MTRAIRDASMVHHPDLLSDPGVPAWLREVARTESFRSLVIVPMLREGRPLGTLNVSRPEGGFSERQIQLLRTFADQAVIAIENVRLFQELQARNRELVEVLERETATGEILRVITTSPADLGPVLEAVVGSAARLCEAENASLYQVEGALMRRVASRGSVGTSLRVGESRPISRGSMSGRAIVDRETVYIPDFAELDLAAEFPETRAAVEREGIRTCLGVPLLREGEPIGALTLYRTEARPFSERQIALVKTFADQAVIAIENVRLFQELGTRNRELTESLEQQTATGEILRVISGSPTDVQPVFDTIVASALSLCDGLYSGVYRLEGDSLRLVAHSQVAPEAAELLRQVSPRRLNRESLVARAILDREVVHVSDVDTDPEVPEWSRGRSKLLGGSRPGPRRAARSPPARRHDAGARWARGVPAPQG